MNPIESDDESLDDNNNNGDKVLSPFDKQRNGVLVTKEADFCRHSKQTSRCGNKRAILATRTPISVRMRYVDEEVEDAFI
jgi:hypothetical protein